MGNTLGANLLATKPYGLENLRKTGYFAINYAKYPVNHQITHFRE